MKEREMTPEIRAALYSVIVVVSSILIIFGMIVFPIVLGIFFVLACILAVGIIFYSLYRTILSYIK